MVGVMVGRRSLESMVKESAARFLQELPTGACDLAGFRSIFFRLLQSSPDPPLDAVWFYAAAAFREARASDANGAEAAARNLFQLLSAFSAGRRGAESVALLAPVVCEVHRLVGELEDGAFSSKKGRRLAGLVEGMVGYIGICSCRDEGCGGRTVCLLDLVRVWTGEEGEEGFVVFFPLVDDRVRSVVREEVEVEYLAAVVMLEAFLLMLRLKLRGWGPRTELQKEIKSWAVGAVTAFRSRFFFDLLLRVLLESSLPRILMLNFEDEALLREALFDTLLLVDYSFLNLGTTYELSDDGLAMTRLMAFLEAVQIARSKGDHSKAIQYSSAFSKSRLPSEIIKWVTNQTEMPKSRLPVPNSPQGLLMWLYTLENERLISLDLSEFRAKFSPNDLKLYSKQESLELRSMKDGSDFFVIDNKGDGNLDHGTADEIEESQSMDSVFLAAAQTIRLGLDKKRKKRKGMKEKDKKRVKFVKYEIDDQMIDNFLPINGNGVTRGNEEANSDSDVSMEETMD